MTTCLHVRRLAAATLGAGLLICAPICAQAEGPTSSSSTSAAPSGATGTITIIAEHNSAIDTVPVPDAVFTISLVDGLDPTTAAGAAQLAHDQQLVADGRTAEVSVHLVSVATPTDRTGRTSICSLPTGAYLVHEIGVPDASGGLVRPHDAAVDVIVALPGVSVSGAPDYSVDVMPKPGTTGQGSPTTAPTGSAPANGGASAVGSGTPVGAPSSVPLSPGTHGLGDQNRPGTTASTGPEAATQGSPAPHTAQPTARPTFSTRINSGDGADFNGTYQWLTIGGAIVLVLVSMLLTRRPRRRDGGR